MLVLVPFTLLQLFSVRGEFVKEVVDNVCLEDFHPQRVGQFLSVSLDLHVERKDRGVPTNVLTPIS